MTCREFIDFINDYLTGELPAGVGAAFEGHIDRCRDCRSYLAQYRATVEAGKKAFADETAGVPGEVPEDLIRAILRSRA